MQAPATTSNTHVMHMYAAVSWSQTKLGCGYANVLSCITTTVPLQPNQPTLKSALALMLTFQDHGDSSTGQVAHHKPDNQCGMQLVLCSMHHQRFEIQARHIAHRASCPEAGDQGCSTQSRCRLTVW